MKTEIYARAVDLQKKIALFEKAVQALEDEFHCSAQMDLDDDIKPDKQALQIVDGLNAKIKTLRGIFANL